MQWRFEIDFPRGAKNTTMTLLLSFFSLRLDFLFFGMLLLLSAIELQRFVEFVACHHLVLFVVSSSCCCCVVFGF